MIQKDILNVKTQNLNSTNFSNFVEKEIKKYIITKESSIIKGILSNVALGDSQPYQEKKIIINHKILQTFFEENNTIDAKINKMFTNSSFKNCHQICIFIKNF